MTSLLPHVLYKYEASASQITSHSLYIFYCTQAKTSYGLRPGINLSIHIDLLCNTLISIIRAEIALHSRRLSSYRT